MCDVPHFCPGFRQISALALLTTRFIVEVQHQTLAEFAVGRQAKGFRLNGAGQIKHYPQ